MLDKELNIAIIDDHEIFRKGLKMVLGKLKNIKIKGLMTIAPLVDNPETARPYFRILRELKDKINSLQLTAYSLQLLSMGMTDDFEVAIEEGSNMIRLGRAIFENADEHR